MTSLALHGMGTGVMKYCSFRRQKCSTLQNSSAIQNSPNSRRLAYRGGVDSEGGSRSPIPVIGAVVAVIALLWGGAALISDGDDASGNSASTSMTTPPGTTTSIGTNRCDARADAAALNVEGALFDYDASESPGDLVSKVDLVLSGQLLMSQSRPDALASVLVKPRRVHGDQVRPPNAFGLPAVDVGRVGQTALFVAFLRSNPDSPGGYEVAVDGLWLACDWGDVAVAVFDRPAGWPRTITLDGIIDEVRGVQRVGEPLVATAMGDGTTVSRVSLVDGTVLALTLPESFGTDLVLGQDLARRSVAQVQGRDFELHIRFGFCTEENLFPNDRGLLATPLPAVDPDVGLVFCRPDEFISMTLNPWPPVEFSPNDFYVIPMTAGDDYRQWLQHNGMMMNPCCFEHLGPMWHEDGMLIAGGYRSTRVQRLDSVTLAPEWTVDLAELLDDGSDRWIGESSYLHGIEPSSGTAIVTTGFGFLIGLDALHGTQQWQIDLEGHSPLQVAATRGGWLVITDILTEGGRTAPKMWKFDAGNGDVLWAADGEPVTDPQWDRPRTVGDIVVMADVPSYTENPTGDETAHLIAFDVETGARRWTFDLDSDTEAFTDRGTIGSDASRDPALLLAVNIDGVVFRIDPGTGAEVWRNEEVPGKGLTTIVGLAPEETTVERFDLFTDLDLDTGEILRSASG
ncbi:MAG: hypothetical protein EX269_14350 [Acidimicrobiales bacterium]|nr:MAG: hypothetical protein EX269_14350 [Acidimicrobiales bacterium]